MSTPVPFLALAGEFVNCFTNPPCSLKENPCAALALPITVRYREMLQERGDFSGAEGRRSEALAAQPATGSRLRKRSGACHADPHCARSDPNPGKRPSPPPNPPNANLNHLCQNVLVHIQPLTCRCLLRFTCLTDHESCLPFYGVFGRPAIWSKLLVRLRFTENFLHSRG